MLHISKILFIIYSALFALYSIVHFNFTLALMFIIKFYRVCTTCNSTLSNIYNHSIHFF